MTFIKQHLISGAYCCHFFTSLQGQVRSNWENISKQSSELGISGPARVTGKRYLFSRCNITVKRQTHGLAKQTPVDQWRGWTGAASAFRLVSRQLATCGPPPQVSVTRATHGTATNDLGLGCCKVSSLTLRCGSCVRAYNPYLCTRTAEVHVDQRTCSCCPHLAENTRCTDTALLTLCLPHERQ